MRCVRNANIFKNKLFLFLVNKVFATLKKNKKKMSEDEIDLGPLTAKETTERLAIEPCVKDFKVRESKTKVVESIRKWKADPRKGRTIYCVQSERDPFEPERAFYERVAATLKKEGYFSKFEDGDMCNGTPKYHWFKITLKPFPKEDELLQAPSEENKNEKDDGTWADA